MAYGGFNRQFSADDNRWMNEVKDAEVMILYPSEDYYKVSKIVLEHFKRKEVRYIHPEEHFTPGEITMQLISEGIEMCEKLLLIVSNFKNNKTFSLEMLLALEKCQRTNCLNLIVLVLEDFSKKDLPKVPMLQNATFVRMDHNIQERCLDEIIAHIRVRKELSTVLPAGNFSAGLAWSHYFGFLEIILPELPNMIRESEWYRNNIGRFPEKFFILLPITARAPALPSVDERISNVGHLPHKAKVAGATREYRIQVYRLSADDGTQYFFCGEIPSAFSAISKVFERMLCNISAEQRNLEAERFSYILQEIINHQTNGKCHHTAKIIVYDDDAKDEDALPSTHILKVVTEKSDDVTRVDTLPGRANEKYRNDVCLIYSEHDERLGSQVRTYLEEKSDRKIRVAAAKLPGEGPREVELRINESRWVILFISKQAMQNSNCIPIWLAELLSISVDERRLRVIPFLIDVLPTDVPNFIRSVTYITKDKHYCKRILQAAQGKDITMESQLPIGNVAYGLAWAFFVNFLQHVLPQIQERGERKLKELGVYRTHVHFAPVVLQLIPESTICKDRMVDNASGRYDVENVGTVAPIEKDVAGIGRVFNINMYRISAKDPRDLDKDVYFMGEYATPVRSLNLMTHSMIAGLTENQARAQAKEFSEQLETILEAGGSDKTCKIILFDDSKEDAALEKIIEEVKRRERAISYGGLIHGQHQSS